MSVRIRVGLNVTWEVENGKRREGKIRHIHFVDGDDLAIIQPLDAKPFEEWPALRPDQLRVPLHDGVFTSDENVEDWMVNYTAARAKMGAALASGVIDRMDDSLDIPEEVVKVIKQIVGVLGTEETIRLLRSLFS